MKRKKIIIPLGCLALIAIGTVSTLVLIKDKTKPFILETTSAKKIARVTGETLEEEHLPNPNQSHIKYGITATDLGIMWDATTNKQEPKLMIAFGDSFDEGWVGFGGGGTGWRSNLLAISEDTDLTDGLTFSSVITEENNKNYAKEIIHSEHDTSGKGDFTTIPTAGVTLGKRHFIHYMQVRAWGDPGEWITNFSEVAYSDDDGENWKNSGLKWKADSNFAQAAYIIKDNYVYMFGTPSGRFGSVFLARVKDKNMLKKEKYEYLSGSDWIQDHESTATAIVNSPVSELSVQHNTYYDKWIMMYLNEDRHSIVIRSSSEIDHGWSEESIVAAGEDFPQLYGGFIHPWMNDGKDLYFNMSLWEPYNVFLMKSGLSKKID